jgi:hypothetical protein
MTTFHPHRNSVEGCDNRDKRGFFKLPLTLLWEVLNDLIAEVDADVFDIVIKEMKEMCWLSQEDNQTVVIFQCPAIGDITMDVCTPVQVQSIVEL